MGYRIRECICSGLPFNIAALANLWEGMINISRQEPVSSMLGLFAPNMQFSSSMKTPLDGTIYSTMRFLEQIYLPLRIIKFLKFTGARCPHVAQRRITSVVQKVIEFFVFELLPTKLALFIRVWRFKTSLGAKDLLLKCLRGVLFYCDKDEENNFSHLRLPVMPRF